MTPSQQLKESLEEKAVAICSPEVKKHKGFDCGLFIFIDDAIEILTTHTIKLLQAEIEVLEGMKKNYGKHENCQRDECNEFCFTHDEPISEDDPIHGAYSYNQALQDQISHLHEQIKE